MISALVEMWAGGLLIGFALGIHLARHFVRKADDSLRAANDELQAEVKRLRAFHALHIGKEHSVFANIEDSKVTPFKSAA